MSVGAHVTAVVQPLGSVDRHDITTAVGCPLFESLGLLGSEIRLVLELFRPFERRGQPEVPIPLQVWPAVECAGGRRALRRNNGGHNQHGDGTG